MLGSWLIAAPKNKIVSFALTVAYLGIGVAVFCAAEKKLCESEAALAEFSALNFSAADHATTLSLVESDGKGEPVCYESLTLIDGLYLTTATISTVGYGDLHPTTDAVRVFTMLYILFGVAYVFALLSSIFTDLLSYFHEAALDFIDRFSHTAKTVTDYGYDLTGENMVDNTMEIAGRIKGINGRAVDLTGDGQIDFIEPPSFAAFWLQELLPAFVLWLALQLLSAAVFVACQPDLSYFGAFYHCYITATTVGFGDTGLRTQAARGWASAHIIVSVSWLAALVAQLEHAARMRSKQLERAVLLTKELHREQIMALDRDGDGVDRLEFVVGMLQLLGAELCGDALRWDDIRPFVKKFEELDVSNTGRIKRVDLDRFYIQCALPKHDESFLKLLGWNRFTKRSAQHKKTPAEGADDSRGSRKGSVSMQFAALRMRSGGPAGGKQSSDGKSPLAAEVASTGKDQHLCPAAPAPSPRALPPQKSRNPQDLAALSC